jgi:glycine hydroxymethyltransferase
MHVIAAKAVAFGEALTPAFKSYQKCVVENAQALAAGLKQRGVRLVGGSTENHLVLLDVGAWGLTGKEVEKALDTVHITVNKNTIPFETRSPFVTSGVRMGSPAVTSRGLGIAEMQQIADWTADVCQALKEQSGADRVLNPPFIATYTERVHTLCKKFPIYKNLG